MKKFISFTISLFCLVASAAMAQNAALQTDTVIGTPFPEVSGESLNEQKVVLPQAAAGKVALILIAVKRDSVPQLDPWLKAYNEAFVKNKSFTVYKIPMMRAAFLKQISSMINGKMKKDNPKELHDNIVTYYGPVENYVKTLEIADKKKGYAFILDSKGVIKWKSTCAADQDSIKEMINAAKLLGN